MKKPGRTKIYMGLLEKLEDESLRDIYFIVISLVLAFGILQTTGTLLNTDKPVVSVVSCSMYPQLNVGDVLIVQGKKYKDIKEGQVIVYSVNEAQLTIEGKDYMMDSYSDKVYDTPAGEIQLVGVTNMDPAGGSEPTHAVIEVNGKRFTVREGAAYQVNGATLKVDDLRGMKIPVVHRVISKSPDSLETKGDNNPGQLSFEKDVRPEQIHGEVVMLVPRIGGLKILVMDLIGFNGDQPLVIDHYPRCRNRV